MNQLFLESRTLKFLVSKQWKCFGLRIKAFQIVRNLSGLRDELRLCSSLLSFKKALKSENNQEISSKMSNV